MTDNTNSEQNSQPERAPVSYYDLRKILDKLGYTYDQEVLVDLVVEGFYSKDDNEWVEIVDPTDIQTNRNHMNLAQAKYYGLKIIRADTDEWQERQK